MSLSSLPAEQAAEKKRKSACSRARLSIANGCLQVFIAMEAATVKGVGSPAPFSAVQLGGRSNAGRDNLNAGHGVSLKCCWIPGDGGSISPLWCFSTCHFYRMFNTLTSLAPAIRMLSREVWFGGSYEKQIVELGWKGTRSGRSHGCDGV
jgi:hypothetical protein